MEQEKRKLCPYDDKRYLLADLPDGGSNPNTHAYGQRDLAAEEHLVADQFEPGVEFIIRHTDERFDRRRPIYQAPRTRWRIGHGKAAALWCRRQRAPW